ncbi:hypothetical protein BaRGS_00019669 [Batillaria attramentaria]|uniref:Uncharacterized protein n=1 Tax=Batillaria attramentaria TaxID=370345 RepID=A0ABD0KP27_9CAEN
MVSVKYGPPSLRTRQHRDCQLWNAVTVMSRAPDEGEIWVALMTADTVHWTTNTTSNVQSAFQSLSCPEFAPLNFIISIFTRGSVSRTARRYSRVAILY